MQGGEQGDGQLNIGAHEQPYNNQMIRDGMRASKEGGLLCIVYFGGGGKNGSFLFIWELLLARGGSELGMNGSECAKLQTQFRWDIKRL